MAISKRQFLSSISLLIFALAILALPVYAQEIGMSKSPSITILEPKDDATVSAGNVTVSVDVKNLDIVDKQGQKSVAGEGHIHYYMDVPVPTTPGKPAITAGGTYVHTIDTSYTWQNVSAGMHNFSVQLVNNDHTPLDPPVLSLNTVKVAGSNETSQIMTVKSVGTQSNNTSNKNVTIDLAAKNIKFDKNTMTVPSGANVTINFDNQESVPHNFALYENSDAKKAIFVGEVITGPKNITYTFVAPTKSGTYFFRCDVHPKTMVGDFIVQ